MTEAEAIKPLTVTLFGPMQASVEGRPLPHLRSRKSLWLLALLILRQSRPVEREWMAGTLWPDADTEQSLTSLRTVLSELRKALGSEGGRLTSPSRHTLALDLSGAEVDLLAFDAAIKNGKQSSLEQAVALYRGPLLEGCAEEWVGQERGAREQDCLKALQTLADSALATGEHGTAYGYYRRAISLDPWAEAARRGLMEALARGGDTNAALQVYREFSELLRDDPKAVPDAQTAALYTRLRAEARRNAAAPPTAIPPPEHTVPSVAGYLPHPLTDIVGREDERLEVAARLRRSRLVTLTGPGGIGKTRLAVEVAAEAAQDGATYADGIWLVALESLAEGRLVERQIASTLNLMEEPCQNILESLTGHLRAKRLLLVLDNCEHLLETSARVAWHLLRECAGIRILATSREALGITGEVAWAVPALAVPEIEHLPTGRSTLVRVLSSYESVQLFVERAQAIQKTFALTGDNALAVARICARLGGLPLAIELAAARVKAMTVEQIAVRLDDHLSLLAGGSRVSLPRQQTLRATLDWSYALLSEPERLLLSRLSAFAGGWTLEAAEGVCGGDGLIDGQVLDLLTALVEKSLVQYERREENNAGRFRLLEVVQQYAKARLESSGAADMLREKHRDWFLELAKRAEPELRGPNQHAWLQRLETDHDNFRAALAWSGTDAEGVGNALRMAHALWWFWNVRGHSNEGRQHLIRVLNREEAQERSVERAKALNAAGALSCIQEDRVAGRAFFEESLEIFREHEDWDSAASALGNLGNIALEQGDYALARARFEESLDIFRQIGNRRYMAASLGNIGRVAYLQSDGQTALARQEEALGIFRELQDQHGTALTLHDLGCAAYLLCDYALAGASHDEALCIFRELKDERWIALSLTGLGSIARMLGNPASAEAMFRESLTISRSIRFEEGIADNLRGLGALPPPFQTPGKAARLWGAAEALRERLGSPLPPSEQQDYNRQVEQIRVALGEDAFAAAWTEGRALTWEKAAASALEEA